MTEHYYCHACRTEFIIIGNAELTLCRHCNSDFIERLAIDDIELSMFPIGVLAIIRNILGSNAMDPNNDDNPNAGVPPASNKFINDLKNNKKISDNNSNVCSICTDNIDKGEEYSVLLCKHIYHTSCIVPWIEKHATCPVCRNEIDKEL